MTAHIVHCRTCKQPMDINKLAKDVDWIMPSRLWYYHKNCYEDWKKSKEHSKEEDWIEKIYDLIVHDLKGAYHFMKIEAQRKKIIDQRMTNKGIYFTLYWYFLIKNNKWKEEYGIGIVPHIYKEATAYWIDKENKCAGIMEQIVRMSKEEGVAKIEKLNIAPRKKRQIKAPE